jgi:serine/threonine protein kinase
MLPYIPFETVLQATDGLSEQHLISELSLSGRLFSGIHPDGTLIVIRELEWSEIFESVISSVAGLRHPNIALLMGFSVGVGDSRKSKRYLIYEFLQGGSFKDRMQQFTWRAKLDVLLSVATALNYASSRDPPVHHGGISDSNILFDHSGNPKLTDFHIVALHSSSYPSLHGDLADFARLLFITLSDDFPAPVNRATLALINQIESSYEISDFRSLLDRLTSLPSVSDLDFPVHADPPHVQMCDEAIQTEPLLPVRMDSADKARCCVIV